MTALCLRILQAARGAARHNLPNRWSHSVRLNCLPLPCQKQPTMTDNRENSREVRTTTELPAHSWRAWRRQPGKE